jgi:hypothetical protein
MRVRAAAKMRMRAVSRGSTPEYLNKARMCACVRVCVCVCVQGSGGGAGAGLEDVEGGGGVGIPRRGPLPIGLREGPAGRASGPAEREMAG